MPSKFKSNLIVNLGAPNLLLVAIVLFHIFFLLFMQPNWMLGGHMWAESATNYFANSLSPNYLNRLFATDFGYVPFPQRLIALIPTIFHLKAAWIPYFYNWSATIISSLLVGSFCLSSFKKLISNDFLRFLSCLAVLIMADFQTRTFVSFSYFAGFFILIITALAAVDDENNVPRLSWMIPIFICSKPSILATLPAMVAISFRSKPRFRFITLTSLFFGFFQIIQLAVSWQTGNLELGQSQNASILEKLYNSFRYFLGFLGGYTFRSTFRENAILFIFAGVLVLVICIYLAFNRKNPDRLVIPISLSAIFFSLLINCFAFTGEFNRDLKQLGGLPINRHNMVAFSGLVFLIAFCCNLLAEHKLLLKIPKLKRLSAISFFLAWFVGRGWLSHGFEISKENHSPWIYNSQWQKLAKQIDNGIEPLCVPIDPLNWIYGKNCKFLNPPQWGSSKQAFLKINQSFFIKPSDYNVNGNLASFALLIGKTETSASAKKFKINTLFKLKNGEEFSLKDESTLQGDLGLYQITGFKQLRLDEIQFIKLRFDKSVLLTLSESKDGQVPLVFWMGS